MPYTIDKTFEFCYGHRVWSQRLDSEFAEHESACACRHLHGHEGRVQVFLSADQLTDGMVTDFKHLTWLKTWLNTYVDHKFIIDVNDPLMPLLLGRRFADLDTKAVTLTKGSPENQPTVYGHIMNTDNTPENSAKYEMFSGMLLVDFVPTSENFAKWLHGLVNEKMKPLGVRCIRIDWWETPKSRSSYSEE